MIRELDFENPEDRKILMHEMDKNIPSMNTTQTNLADEEMATPGQIKFLRGLRYDGDPAKLTKRQASEKIKELQGGN